ncbi:YL1-domain-containing protein [Clavulina sp. PMI_390]|nr:YL1-domain-containing protein [Clavulina sp. PMI_390]
MASLGLAAGRARRHGAGNRMRALLDGVFEAEEGFQEAENDEEFEFKGEGDGDVYDSDFKSSEDEDEAELAGENEVQAEARRARKEARKKAERVTAISRPAGLKPSLHSLKQNREAHDAQKPEDEAEAEPSSSKPAKRRRYLEPVAIDDETGEVLDNATRKSSRHSTVRSKKELHSKIKDEQERRAALPKKKKSTARQLTQDELIAEALETEEINSASLNDFLTEEEERRLRNSNLKREAIQGPFLRFVSRGEKVRLPLIVEVEVPAPPPPTSYYKRPYVPSPLANLPPPPTAGAKPATTPSSYYSPYLNGSYTPGLPPTPKAAASSKDASSVRSWSNPYQVSSPASRSPNTPATTSTSTSTSTATPRLGKLVTQTKNYVVLHTPDSTPAEDYAYVFGDHVDWGNLKVLPKNRPSLRKPTQCQITGLSARYSHPSSGIPYANLTAYRTIESLLRHQYVWSEGLDCYVGDDHRTEGATGVPDGWSEAVMGKRTPVQTTKVGEVEPKKVGDDQPKAEQ